MTITPSPVIDAARAVVHAWRLINEGPRVTTEELARLELTLDNAILTLEDAILEEQR